MELIIMGSFMILAFFVGRYSAGYKEEKKEPVIKKKKPKTDNTFQLDEATITMLENIDNYDGSGLGQKDVPDEEV
jgi:hypothetical protein